MNQLIPINEQKKTVNARDLHEFLEVKKDFSDWFKLRVKSYGFVEGVDFIALPHSGEANYMTSSTSSIPTNKIDYHVTIDMAKQLSMIERTQKGKEARLYFIECEKQSKVPQLQNRTSAVEIFDKFEVMGRRLGAPEHVIKSEAVRNILKITGEDYTPLLNASPSQSNIKSEEMMLEPTELGKIIGASSIKTNNILQALKLQTKNNGVWTPTEEGFKYSFRNNWTVKNKSGYNYKWNVEHIKSLLKLS